VFGQPPGPLRYPVSMREVLGMCYILCMCVCVGASDVSDTTTASDDPYT
jgi:hypothetical protein